MGPRPGPRAGAGDHGLRLRRGDRCGGGARRPGRWRGGATAASRGRRLDQQIPRPGGKPHRHVAVRAAVIQRRIDSTTKGSKMVRVMLPFHLRTLANVGSEVTLDVAAPVTQRSILDALEARYPTLRGTVRDRDTQKRRALVR